MVIIKSDKKTDKWLDFCRAWGQTHIGLYILIHTKLIDLYYLETFRHEKIHIHQQRETLIIGFYVIYILNFLVRFVIGFISMIFRKESYKNFWWETIKCFWTAYLLICFEQEAYAGEHDIIKRKRFAWIKYVLFAAE